VKWTVEFSTEVEGGEITWSKIILIRQWATGKAMTGKMRKNFATEAAANVTLAYIGSHVL
jgi:hypothetical protein